MRLSRKAMIVLTSVGGLGLGAILIVPLQDRDAEDKPTELFSTDRVQQAAGLSTLPQSYAGIPQLGGPPLPGDLGRPILSARERGLPVAAPAVVGLGSTTADPDEQLRLQEIEAARLSRLFADSTTASEGTAPSSGLSPLPSSNGGSVPASNPIDAGPLHATARREAFLDRPADLRTTSTDRLEDPVSPYLLQAGAVIPAALVTGLRSDLPGQIVAQVTSPVYDSPPGRYLLIPQGARLIGEYDSRVASGQSRLLLVWNRLILSDGRSIIFERQPGADAAGYAGLEDGVDGHWGRLFLTAGLATVLNIGTELGARSDDEIAPGDPRWDTRYHRPRRRRDRPPPDRYTADAHDPSWLPGPGDGHPRFDPRT